PWVASLEQNLERYEAQLASSAQLAISPKPPTGAETAGGDAFVFGAADATPGPASTASAATNAMIAAPRLVEVFLAISLSLSLSASAHEPQSVPGLCEGKRTGASPVRGSAPSNSLGRGIRRKKARRAASQLAQQLPWWEPRQQVAKLPGLTFWTKAARARAAHPAGGSGPRTRPPAERASPDPSRRTRVRRFVGTTRGRAPRRRGSRARAHRSRPCRPPAPP